MILAERAAIHHFELAIIGNAASGQYIPSAPIGQLEGTFKIPSTIETPRFSARLSIDALYFQRMSRYLSGVLDDLSNPPVIIPVDLSPLLRLCGPEVLTSALRARSWYRSSMDMGRVVLHARSDEITSSPI